MKRIIFGLMLAMMFCTLVQGANRTVTENDGQGNKKRVIELRDTVINGETVTDTLSVMITGFGHLVIFYSQPKKNEEK